MGSYAELMNAPGQRARRFSAQPERLRARGDVRAFPPFALCEPVLSRVPTTPGRSSIFPLGPRHGQRARRRPSKAWARGSPRSRDRALLTSASSAGPP
jgi:hypothetical protein